MTQPIVITGLGVLACNGLGRQAFWDAIEHGRSGIRRLDRFDASDLPCQ
ncbi:MAG TPA: beta-ketoacyl synthase N-terminal-like domain-containing protein, partial [Candidatus Bathyarchaeia archaeon]|nr:beta-ketoacyl synthase N-terminal-like domain-containing protein [Candidatus Bathyarchaeia archaeon]